MPPSDDIQVLQASRRAPPGHRAASESDAGKLQAEPGDSTVQTYLRQVRRLRQQYAGDPARLQQRLGELSRRHDRAHPRAPLIRSVEPEFERYLVESDVRRGTSARPAAPLQSRFSRAVVDWFADHVASQLDERLLHFSKRQALLKTAQSLGIGRFHANLIIAVAQHQAGDGTVPDVRIQPAADRSFPVTFAIILAVQTLILFAVWFMFRV